MNLQRISEFAENQEGKPFLFLSWPGRAAQLTSGSFRLSKLCEQRRFG